MVEVPVRIKLDLTKVCLSEYRHVWFPVTFSTLNTISDLKTNICKNFSLSECNMELYLDGGLLRDEETILLLRENDRVQVIEKQHSQWHAAPCRQPSAEDSYVSKGKSNPRKRIAKRDLPGPACSGKSRHLNERPTDEVVLNGDGGSPREVCLLSPHDQEKRKKKKKQGKDESVATLDVTGHSDVLTSNCRKKSKKEKNRDEKFTRLPVIKIVHLDESCGSLGKCDTEKRSTMLPIHASGSHPREEQKHKVANALDSSFTISDKGNRNTTSCSDKSGESVHNGSSCVNDLAEVVGDISVMETSNASALEPSDLTVGSANQTIGVQGSSCPKKRRRKRRRKRPTPSNDVIGNVPVIEKTEPAKQLQVSNGRRAGTHIKFDTSRSDSESEKSDPLQANEKLSPFSSLCKSESNPWQNSTPVVRKTSLWDVASSVTLDLPPAENEPCNRSTPKLLMAGTDGNDLQGKEEAKEKTDYSAYPSLKTLPSVGMHIAYKILELSDLYCPELSDYKEGTVLSIEPSTDVLTVELSQEVIKSRLGKFENLYEDSPETEVYKVVNVSWGELVEPKLLK